MVIRIDVFAVLETSSLTEVELTGYCRTKGLYPEQVKVGIGGGSFKVPILTAYSYATYKAVGSAAGIGLIISLQGALLCC